MQMEAVSRWVFTNRFFGLPLQVMAENPAACSILPLSVFDGFGSMWISAQAS